MAWPPRIEFPGAIYHVTSRGIEPIFRDEVDRERFLALLTRAVRTSSWLVHAYCLMGNHFHLLVETPEPTLAQGMQELVSGYARTFNIRHGRRGPLVERRYHALPIEREAHLVHVARYVVLNPVRAGLCATPADWGWSSYRGTAGLQRAPRFLSTDWLLSQFRGDQAFYREFVEDGVGAASLPGPLV